MDCDVVCSDSPKVFDDCNVCDGVGIPIGKCDCQGNVEDCSGVCGGTAIDNDNDGICDELQGTVADIDGNTYKTIKIGDQTWMVENLKTTHYNDGSEIIHIINNDDWDSYDEGQYSVYGNVSANADMYGNLYNWFVVDDDRGV